MANYQFVSIQQQSAIALEFVDVQAILKGRSIVSMADWGERRIEFGLSGDLMLRVDDSDGEISVDLFETRNPDEIPALIVSMGDMGRRVPIDIIETKLRGLRTMYAAFYLTQNGRARELEAYLLKHPYGDFEKALLNQDEQLHIESISYGSWVMTVWSKAQGAYKAVASVAGMVFARGREAYLQKQEAEAKLKTAEARLKEAEVEEKGVDVRSKEFDLQKRQIDYMLEAAEKIKAPEVKEILRGRLIHAAKDFLREDKSDDKSYRQLEG